MGNKASEDYLRAFYYLEQKGGRVPSSSLADYLRVSRPGVSEMLVFLDRAGLVKRRRYGLASLTRRGRSLARKMTFKHRVLESFLSKKLGMRASLVHREACALEHAASDDVIARLYKFLGRPSADPHGQPIVR